MLFDHYRIAVISLAGMGLDLLGGLFLAYDLLGQRHGPLRFLLRLVIYSVLFGAPYTIVLGARFGVPAGVGLGSALAFELMAADPAAQGVFRRAPRIWLAVFRGAVLGAGGAWAVSSRFGLSLGVLTVVSLLIAYRLRFAPTDEAERMHRPHLNARKTAGAFVRGLLLGTSGVLAGLLAQQGPQAVQIGLKIGAVVGAVGLLAATFNPWVEWYTDHIEDRRLGILGLVLILAGMSLQSVQYWVVVIDPANH